MSAEARLTELGLVLPSPTAPGGAFVAARYAGDQLHVSGRGPVRADGTFVRGKLGADLTLEQGREAARLAALGVLSVLRAELGTLDRVVSIARVVGYVNCAPGFNDTPAVMDGCSLLLLDVLGRAGRHARSAVGVAELPFDMAVEIEVTAIAGRGAGVVVGPGVNVPLSTAW